LNLGKIKYSLIVILFLSLLFLIPSITPREKNTHSQDGSLKIYSSSKEDYSDQWLENPSFDSPDESWFCTIQGDNSDVSGCLSDGKADFNILGDKHTFSLIADPPLALDWNEVDNPNFPNHPDIDEINADGCRVSHEWDDTTAVQNPSVHWDRNVTVSVNMLDYEITSASIQAIVNATVDENLDRYYDYYYGRLARTLPNEIVDTYGVGDYVKFYVLISDLEKSKVYEIANLQTEVIGNGAAPGIDYLFDTYMISVPEDVLKFYLSSVLNTDSHNFTVSLGIRLNIEDNVVTYYDLDTFNELIIKYLNLTFTYEKKIDQLTTISWNQIGDSINGNNIVLKDANLYFKYNINQIWPQSSSLNSGLQIIINNYELEKTIKLSSINTSFQEMYLGEDNVLSYILTNINISISIQVFIADEFVLENNFTISIDDVYLTISYIKIIEDPPLSYDFLWIILLVAIMVIGILGSLSLRSYLFVPRRQRRESYLMLRTQKFKDIRNLQAIIAMYKPSGLPVYTQSYSSMMKGKNTLFSGFIQAISIIGEEITRSDKKSSKMKIHKDKVDFHKVVELDLKQFHCLVLDVEELRTVLILKSKSSKRLKDILVQFSFIVYVKVSERLKDWNNEINGLDESIQPLVNEYFDIFYKDPFKANIQESELLKYKKKLDLSKFEFQIMTTIFSLLKEKSNFKLMDILERKTDKNEDGVINALESLIEFKLISPIK
jgi:hypothetical protein